MISPRSRLNKVLAKFEHSFETYNRLEISASAILHNLDMFAGPDRQVIPVLKSNAYGHGLSEVTTILKARKLPYVAADGYFEALRIREVSQQPVLIMGAIRPENYRQIKLDGFAFVVHDQESIKALGALGRSVKIHLEVNTGMNRHGIDLDELGDYLELIARQDKLELEGVMSHLADADAETDDYTVWQVDRFDKAVEQVLRKGFKPKLIHLAQTAGSTQKASRYANTIRLGIGLYGLNPLGGERSMQLVSLRPALSLVSTITKIISLKKGDKVSYNGMFVAPADMQIGVLPLGYYEGVPRALSIGGQVKLGKKYLPIAGRVCMNHFMIDLRGVKAKVGDEVTVISPNRDDHNSLDGICQAHGLFNYEMAVKLSQDLRRVIVD